MAKPAKNTQCIWPRCQVEQTDALKENDKEFEANKLEPENAKLWFERAGILASMGNMREAIEALSRAIAIDPFCGIYYRWRGHRHLNCGDVEEAAADFMVASHLIPDNWDVWYHLGLCNTVLGRREAANYAHKKCWEMYMIDQKRVALVNWSWINLSLLGRKDEANALLEKYIRPGIVTGPDACYLKMCLAYKGDIAPEELLKADDNDEEPDLTIMTQAFGLANYYLINGQREKYDETIDFIVENGTKAWNCFGYSSASYIQRTRK